MNIPVFIIDTFTGTQFKGNPAGVCYLREDLSTGHMLSIAKELNLPVTAFVKKDGTVENSYTIRYFTPLTEIAACGHATLGSSSAVMELDVLTTVTFHTIENLAIQSVLQDGLIRMVYPKYSLTDVVVGFETLSSLQINNYKLAGYCQELETLFIEIENPLILRNIKPDYQKLVASNHVIKEVVITSVSDNPSFDFLLRSFCPWIGIDEDPVTGSIHSVLAGFWQERLHKNILHAFQASERGGEVIVKSFDDKVEIGGRCVKVLKGELSIGQ